ncbi:MAG: DNA translocase FtsK 4TM domain-containing protein [Alphaproteobacteria bacterium]|nr:DNA translocase FtsK 4TM domain-containing protein [Alphaproteobacteria bacterium]
MAGRQTGPANKSSSVIKVLLRFGAGLSLLAASIWLVAILVSYDRLDPSWNTAIDGPTHNMGGTAGAFISDVLMQLLGNGSYFAVASGLSWGASLLFGRALSFWAARLTVSVFCLGLTSFLWSIWDVKSGGLLGSVLQKIASPLMAKESFLTSVGGFFLFLCLAFFALNLRLKDFGIFGKFEMRWRLPRPTLRLSPQELGEKIGASLYHLRNPSQKKDRAPQRDRVEPTASTFGPPISKDMEPAFPEIFDVAPHTENDASPMHVSAPFQEDTSAPASTPTKSVLSLFSSKKDSADKKAKKDTPYDLSRAADSYQLPSLELLVKPIIDKSGDQDERTLQENARALAGVLDDYGVRGDITRVCPGPVVTLYELTPAPGVKSSRVTGLSDDIARSMCAASARVAVVPGKNALGIELPNEVRQTVFLRELMTGKVFDQNSAKLALALGKDIAGNPIIADLARMPHLLVAGTTGSGKSVAVNTMVLSLLYRLSPQQCRFIMIDPKMLELSVYNEIPHLLCPVVTEPKKAIYALKWAVREMEDRYRAMSRLGVRNIEGYNARLQEATNRGETLSRQVHTGFDPDSGKPIYETQPLDMTPLPYIVIIVDEMADLMMVAGKEIEIAVQRLAQMARAAGLHLIMATQRPSVDVITGTIKANFPTRISFQVTSKFDSRTILGEQGAEQLLGRGDMLFMEGGGRIQRVHGPFVSDEEVEKVVEHLKLQGFPEYIENVTDESADAPLESFGGSGDSDNKTDALYQQAVAIVTREGKASTSFVQRQLQIGYNKAARIMEQMEAEGVVSPANHVGKREVLVKSA